MKIGFLVVFGMIVFSSCTGDGNSVESAAKNICECTQPIVKINEEIQVLQNAGKVDKLTALIEKIDVAFNDAVKCAKENVNDKMDKKELKVALENQCEMNPRLVSDLMNQL